MRNVIFRGKRKDNGKWCYGSLITEYDGTLRISWWEDKLIEPDVNYYEPVNFCEEIIKETLGQYTELNDNTQNEIKIFEGDIVNCYDKSAKDDNWHLDKESIGVIEYTPDCYSLKIPGKLLQGSGSIKRWTNDIFLQDWSNAECIEVVGNIFDNPMLKP